MLMGILLQALLCFTAVEMATAANKTLHFSFITAFSGGTSSSGGIPIVDFALEEINNDTNVLNDYELRYPEVLDSKCTGISALESFLSQFDNTTEPTYVSVMCCGCGSATIPVAEISHHWNVPQISFASSSPALNNRKRFKSFFRTLPCYVYVPPTVAALMEEFGWTQMAIITQNQSPFSTVTTDIERIFENEGWLLDRTSVIDPDDDAIEHRKLLDWDGGDYRIIMLNTFEDHAYQIVCEAYKKYGQKLLDQEIVLILHGRYRQEWWETAHENVNSSCTRDEVMIALNYTLTLTPDTYDLMDDPTAKAYSGITPPEFKKKYDDLLKLPKYNSYTALNFYGNAYDAMWAIALGLDLADKWVKNGTEPEICKDQPGELVTLDQFNYTNKKMGCLMREGFAATKFTGITGRIQFKSDGARPENVMRLRQHRIKREQSSFKVMRPTVARVINEDTYKFGIVTYHNNGSVVFGNGESYTTLWLHLEGNTPYDGMPVDVVDPTNRVITVFYCLLGSIGLVFALACLVFNTVFRKRKSIKLGSPNLNFLIIIGAAVLYVSIYFYSISAVSLNQETILCNFRIWLFVFGYTLCFAVILAKQWRVYYIFSNPTPSKMIIKDWMLLVIVGILVAVDLLILMIGTAAPQSRLVATSYVEQELRKNEDGVNEKVHVFTCSNTYDKVWIAVSFAYKGLLQLAAIFMAFTTRKVSVKALNDTKENCAMIYVNSLLFTVLIVTEFAIKGHHNTYTALFGLAVFLEATLFLGIVFITKAVYLYLDPHGEKVFTETQPPTSMFSFNKSDDEVLNTAPAIKTKIAELQRQLALLETNLPTQNGHDKTMQTNLSTQDGHGKTVGPPQETVMDEKYLGP